MSQRNYPLRSPAHTMAEALQRFGSISNFSPKSPRQNLRLQHGTVIIIVPLSREWKQSRSYHQSLSHLHPLPWQFLFLFQQAKVRHTLFSTLPEQPQGKSKSLLLLAPSHLCCKEGLVSCACFAQPDFWGHIGGFYERLLEASTRS